VSNLSGGWITSLTNNGVILGLGAAGVLN
jgi:hypothetical protein